MVQIVHWFLSIFTNAMIIIDNKRLQYFNIYPHSADEIKFTIKNPFEPWWKRLLKSDSKTEHNL